MPGVDALIFDLDGTLVDSYEAIHESLSTAMRAKGMTPLDPPAVRRMVGRGLELLVRDAMGPENTEEGVRLYRAHYDRICLAKSKLLPGVRETLQWLTRRACRWPCARTSWPSSRSASWTTWRWPSASASCSGPRTSRSQSPIPRCST